MSDLPVNLLALDGGGVRGISELRILQIIMGRLKARLGLPDDADDPLPCDYFQLIGGTSTGGLIAIMLSRLRMTAVEAAEQYNDLAKEIFGPKNKNSWVQDGAFKATTLQKAFERSQTLKLKKIYRWRPGRQAQDREEWKRSNLEDERRFESQVTRSCQRAEPFVYDGTLLMHVHQCLI